MKASKIPLRDKNYSLNSLGMIYLGTNAFGVFSYYLNTYTSVVTVYNGNIESSNEMSYIHLSRFNECYTICKRSQSYIDKIAQKWNSLSITQRATKLSTAKDRGILIGSKIETLTQFDKVRLVNYFNLE